MNINLMSVTGFAAVSVGAFSIYKAAALFLTPRKGLVRKAVIFLLFAAAIINKSWIGDENSLYILPFIIGGFLLCYEEKWYSKLAVGLIFYSLFQPLFMMIDTLLDRPVCGQYYDLVQNICKSGLCLLLWSLLRRIVPKNGIYPLPNKLWGLLSGLAMAPLFSTLSFTIWKSRDFDFDTYQMIAHRIAFTILPFTVLSAIAILIALVVLSRHEQLEKRQKLAELQEVYYQGLKREQTGVRTLRHDLHNHITAAQGLLERGDLDGVKRYLEELSASPALTGDKRYCENDIANAVISSKSVLIEQSGITTDFEMSLPSNLEFPDVDLCALLGNALDNAVEATSEAVNKRILLRARADKGTLMLRLENTFSRSPQKYGDVFITAKKDSVMHGLGVAGMREIARRHGGVCEMDYTESVFRLLVSIPLKSTV